MKTFEPQLNLDNVVTAWRGHRAFAQWLVETLRPDVVVDLGVDQGYSTICFAEPHRGQVYAVDCFEGDEHTGFRDTQYAVQSLLLEYDLRNVTVLKTRFEDLAVTWSQPIDILHIDGLHTYEACKTDWGMWAGFVRPTGAILFHDVVSFPDVRQVFDECGGIRLWFEHSAGLGIVLDRRNTLLADLIVAAFPEVHRA